MPLCSRCETIKPLSAFHRDSERREGFRKTCAECRNQSLAQGRIPGSREAHKAVLYALRHGELARPMFCEGCQAGGRLDAHHEDYGRPLDVEWLCRRCHAARHAEAA